MARIKVRAREHDGVVTVKTLMTHPMEMGLPTDSITGESNAPHFIKEVTATYRDQVVVRALWGPGVSKNPFWAFKFTGAQKGEQITITWLDNRGERASVTKQIA